MKELVKAVRHDALGAIDKGEKLLAALGEEGGEGTDKLRRATKRFVRHLKEELADWEDKYKRARLEE
ncbi:MAG TPA: hypothetical protein VH852_02300 [Hyphomicrobium sp.]|jgi:hypothetical protein